MNEVLVAGPTSPAVSGIDDVAGKTIHMRRSSSYYESLASLNRRFEQEKKEPVKIVLVPDALEDEDLMEMLNAGLFEFIIVDDWLVKYGRKSCPRSRFGMTSCSEAAEEQVGQSGRAARSLKLRSETSTRTI